MNASTASAPALTFQTTTFSPVVRDGQPWLRAAEIAAALGYANADAVGKLYQRNSAEFTDAMTLTVDLTVKGFGNGESEKQTRIFSLRGAHLLGMFARTDRAAAFRRWVLDVLDRQVGVAQPVPVAPASPPLTHADLMNLRLAVRHVSSCFFQEASANAMVWRVLRQVCGRPAPEQFRESDIPALSAELTRLLAAGWKVRDFRHDFERDTIAALARGRDVADILRGHEAEKRKQLAASAADFSGKLERWQEWGLVRFVNREAVQLTYQPQGDEA